MHIRSIKPIFFSPTETTAKIVNKIAQGINPDIITGINLTPPGARNQNFGQLKDELTIIGTPVYAGRVSPEAIRRLRKIRGNNTPAVVVVVYGNRDFEDALLELKDIVAELGFHPIAGGAFIGEHSYSNETTQIAVGRPDDQDMEIAKRFGEAIKGKMSKINTLDGMPALEVPGNFPYKKWVERPEMAPVTVESLCTLCADCAAVCPTGAITVGDLVVTAASECIRCSACIKKCPAGARKWENAWLDQIRKWLYENCRQRKEPQIYL
jgi:ferredoxin